jgi:hypothetical protein
MSRLKTWKLFIAVMAGCVLLLGVQDARSADPTPGQMKSTCQKNGGLYGAPTAAGVYWCLTKDDKLVICGGNVPPGHKNCQVYRTVDGGRLNRWNIGKIVDLRSTAARTLTGDQMRCISCYQSCPVGDIRCRSRCNLTSACIGAITTR